MHDHVCQVSSTHYSGTAFTFSRSTSTNRVRQSCLAALLKSIAGDQASAGCYLPQTYVPRLRSKNAIRCSWWSFSAALPGM